MTPSEQAAEDAFMRKLARKVSSALNRIKGTRPHFLLLVFIDDKRTAQGGRVNYISDVERESARGAMKEVLARWDSQDADVRQVNVAAPAAGLKKDPTVPAPANGRPNVYICQACSGRLVTRDRDFGTVPFTMSCRVTEGCVGRMFSEMYRVDPGLRHEATHEWRKPTKEEVAKMTPGEQLHAEGGGMFLHKIE